MLILTAAIKDGPIHLIDETTGEHMEISVLGVKGLQVRLGFSGSSNIKILRDVLYQAEQRGNE